MTEEEKQETRDKWHILCEGEDLPPPIKSFKDMRFPECIIARHICTCGYMWVPYVHVA